MMRNKPRLMRYGWLMALALLILFAGAAVGFVWLQPSATVWEPAIRAFEEQDRRQPPEPGQAVFVGGSSIRFWSTLAADMSPIPVLNRGFGGAKLRDVLHYADRVILSYRPRAVVIYAGENDLGSWWAWPGLVVERFQQLVERLRQSDPKLPILVLAIKPSPHFATRLARQQEANRQLRAYCEMMPGLRFIDVASPLLDAEGRLRPELYRDGLHLNAAGYAVWRAQVRPVLLAVLGLNSESAGSDTTARVLSAPAPTPSSAPDQRADSPLPSR